MTTPKIYRLNLMIVAMVATLLICSVYLLPSGVAIAADLSQSAVLYDLQKDATFDLSAYPEGTTADLDLFQIGESDTNELYVYIYQPNYKKTALQPFEIAISITGDTSEPLYKTYGLSLVNSYKTLFKYRVDDLIVDAETSMRSYDISTMWRKWVENVDAHSGTDNTIDGVAVKVAKNFLARTTEDGNVEYALKQIDIVTITDAYVGMCRYYDGITWLGYVKGKTDSHYIAFSTDRQIDTLMEADVQFDYRTVNHTSGTLGGYTYGDWQEKTVYLDASQKGSNKANGWFAYQYEWDRILTAEEFLADPDTDFTDEAKNSVRGKQWVLRFYETDLTQVNTNLFAGQVTTTTTEVYSVAILRLKFETAGKIYNLGVVSNQQTGSQVPDNTNTTETSIDKWIDEILGDIEEWIKEALKYLIYIAIGIAGVMAVLLVGWAIFAIASAVRQRRKAKKRAERERAKAERQAQKAQKKSTSPKVKTAPKKTTKKQGENYGKKIN